MRSAAEVLGPVVLAVGMGAALVAPAAAADAPAGAADGCHLMLPSSHQDDGSGASRTSSIDLDHPASVKVASDCAGSPLSVADVLSILAAGPVGIGGGMAQNFANNGCQGDATLGAIDVTGLFKSGTYWVGVSTKKDWNCPGPSSNPDIYLIVKQHA
jgi:hypothetical protein